MSRTEQMTPLDERMVAEAEADLQQLLAIEPSPEFATRVRTRIHDAGESYAPRWGWIGLAIAAAAALIVVAVLRTSDRSPVIQNAEIVGHSDTRLAVEHNRTPVTAAAHDDAVHKRSGRTAAATSSAEVIIDPAMTAAIQRLAAAARNTILDASKGESIAADANAAALPIAEPLKVPELVLGPVDPTGGQ